MSTAQPTPYPEVNAMLQELLPSVQAVLGPHFVGMYLDGSLTSSDFDEASDIDFVVASDIDISGELFDALLVMHERIAQLDSPYATDVEGSYLSQHALRRYDPAHALHPNIERGPSERLKMAVHDEGWIVHRSILLERGITLVGPALQTLIDPVTPQDLRRAMLHVVQHWAADLLNAPAQISSRGGQSYIVLSLCRMLYTLYHGTVASKLVAARWALENVDERWRLLIERALIDRKAPNPGLKPAAEAVSETMEFLRYTVERSQQYAKTMVGA